MEEGGVLTPALHRLHHMHLHKCFISQYLHLTFIDNA